VPKESPQTLTPFSFRDPGGGLAVLEGRVIRIVNQVGQADLSEYLGSEAIRRLVESGRAVRARVLEGEEARKCLSDDGIRTAYEAIGGTMLVEHDRIDFPSYPYEWAPEMLEAAGAATIELAQALAREGRGLKDATPLNILFRGTTPVFIDALSVEKRTPGDQRWLGYAQFVRNFILPLAVARDLGMQLGQIFLTRRDGLEPEDVYRMLGPLRRMKGLYFGLVTMPQLLGERRKALDTRIYQQRIDSNTEKSQFVFESILRGLHKRLKQAAAPVESHSTWSDYMSGNNNYQQDQFSFKEEFVKAALESLQPKQVLDVGCNDGHFSAMAARAGASVVALDYDPVVVGRVYRRARAESLAILPLAVDLTRPTPATGWNNSEFPSFLDRARGRFDCVLMLAVVHHMLVTERIPLDAVMETAASLARDGLVIEFVHPEDSMFRRLTRGRDHLHAGLNEGVFERAFAPWFEQVGKELIPGAARTLYLLRKRK